MAQDFGRGDGGARKKESAEYLDDSQSSVPTDLTITESSALSLCPDDNSDRLPSKLYHQGHRNEHLNDQHKYKAKDDRIYDQQDSWEEKYASLLAEFNNYKIAHVSATSNFESDLKIKNFELKRISQLLKKTESQLKVISVDKKTSQAKVQELTEELETEKRFSQERICKLTMEIHEKTVKLDTYEKIQTRIDKILFPDLPVEDVLTNDNTVEGILSNYGYGTNISIDAKIRLQQSLDLAKRLASERDHLEKARDDAQAKLSDLEKKYQGLLIDLNQFKLSDSCRTADTESELKLKRFELERLSLLYSEVNNNYKSTLMEKERLVEKLDVLREEHSTVKTQSDRQITELSLQLQEKSAKLETYDKLEAELDKVVIQAATLPSEHDSSEILAAYGYGANIPSNARRRLEQSLKLARRVLELEYKASEYKKELYSIRDQNLILRQELDAASTALENTGHPTAELLQVIQKRDLAIMKLKEKISELQLSIDRITKCNLEFQEQLKLYSREVRQSPPPYRSLRIKEAMSSGSESRLPASTSSLRFIRTCCKCSMTSSQTQPNTSKTSLFSNSSTRVHSVQETKITGCETCSPVSLIHIRKPLTFSKISRN